MVSINKPVARSAMVALGCCAAVRFGQAWRQTKCPLQLREQVVLVIDDAAAS